MKPPLPPPDEAQRLATLRRYNLLDTAPEQALDDLTTLAAHIFGAPIALISLVDERRQWFKSKAGLAACETPRDISFCAHALRQTDLFVVTDALLDPRFADNPLVTGEPRIRFYAGAPLVTPEGHVLGTLCVIDRKPKELTPAMGEALLVLGRQVMAQLELRRHARELARSERLLRAIFDSEPECVKLLGRDGSLLMMNRAGLEMIQADSLAQVEGACVYPLVAGEHRASFEAMAKRVFGGESGKLEFRIVGLKGGDRWLETHAAPLRGEEGEVTALLAITRDITARRQAEDRIGQLNRVQAFLGDINKSIVREPDPGKLFDTACRVAVQTGGFLMAWIGLVGAETGRTELAAHAGASPKTVELLKAILALEDAEGACAFTRQALQTGGHAVCNDIENDPRAAGWRAAALERGYRTMASFPVKLGERVTGVFNLYSGRVGAFDQEELRLLDELAGNISFAMDLGRREAERQRAETALRGSEERFSKAFHATPAAIAISTRAEGRYVDVNEFFAEMFGYGREEVIGRRALDVGVWTDPAQRADIMVSLAEGRPVRAVECLYRTKSGAIRTALTSAELIELGGEPCVLFINHDITERKLSEAALRASEERFRELAENIEEVFWATDKDNTHIHYISPAYEKIWGRTRQSLYEAPQAWLDAVHPGDRDRVRAASARRADGRFDEEYRVVRPDGSFRWVRDKAFPVRNAEGRVERVVGAARDVTERNEAHAELKRREDQFRSLIEHASDLITVVNATGVIRFQSPAIERVLGYSVEEITGQSAFQFVHPDDAGGLAAAIQRATTGPAEPVAAEIRFRHKNGQWRLLQTLGRSIPGNAPDGFIVVNSRDITDSRQLEAQLRQSQKMEAIGQLAGGVAHDFNNILAAILMQAELAGSEDNTAQETRDFLRDIKGAVERASGLTRQLLAFSRLQVLQTSLLDLNVVVDNLVKMLWRILGEHVTLGLNLHPSPLPTRADAGMLDQVLLNLVLNARDAMPNGGHLVIETGDVNLTQAEASAIPDASPGGYVFIRVSDNGVGIAPENLPRIFEPFFTTKGPGKGTGVGLATVFGIVKQHGGAIAVESAPGGGSTFRVYLPASEDTLEAPSRPSPNATPRGGTETVLLVEDDANVRTLTRSILGRAGYRVLEAPDGVEALRLWDLHRDSIALLLTDIVMPKGVSGWDLAATLQPQAPRLRVIFTSGYSAEIAGRELLLEEGQNFIPKPASPTQLLETVRRALDGY